ncbi:hypothetical protein BH11MYX1_BH11MYX1_38740 [soil metagenome]
MRHARLWFGLILVGCAGKAPPDQPTLDAAADAPGDGGMDVTTAKVSGTVHDYFTGDPLATTAITTVGLQPELATTTNADGTYAFEVAVGSKLFATASHSNFFNTRNATIAVAQLPVSQELYALASGDIGRQFSTAGVAMVSGTILVAELQDDLGAPLAGILPAAITLVDGNGTAVAGVSAPFFMNAADVDPSLAMSTAFGSNPARARVALLNAPPGSYTLKVNYTDANLAAATHTTSVTISAGGATLAVSGGLAANSSIAAITDPSFATDIYPRLQKASKGGLGCASCHNPGGTGAVLPYDNSDPAVVLAAIKAAANVINPTTPAMSTFLAKPLFETTPPQNHPNATFLDVNDPTYKLFLLWITLGTKP